MTSTGNDRTPQAPSPGSPRRTLRDWMLGLAIFQGVSTAIGFVQLLVTPWMYEPVLRGSVFAGHYVAAGLLLGLIVGGAQWVAVWVHLHRPAWLALGHVVAGTVMLGWIAGECLVIGTFMWAHALWGGIGAIQLLLALVYLGVLRPHPELVRCAASPLPGKP